MAKMVSSSRIAQSVLKCRTPQGRGHLPHRVSPCGHDVSQGVDAHDGSVRSDRPTRISPFGHEDIAAFNEPGRLNGPGYPRSASRGAVRSSWPLLRRDGAPGRITTAPSGRQRAVSSMKTEIRECLERGQNLDDCSGRSKCVHVVRMVAFERGVIPAHPHRPRAKPSTTVEAGPPAHGWRE